MSRASPLHNNFHHNKHMNLLFDSCITVVCLLWTRWRTSCVFCPPSFYFQGGKQMESTQKQREELCPRPLNSLKGCVQGVRLVPSAWLVLINDHERAARPRDTPKWTLLHPQNGASGSKWLSPSASSPTSLSHCAGNCHAVENDVSDGLR